MYSYADRIRAVELYIKLGLRAIATIRQLGCPRNVMAEISLGLKNLHSDAPNTPANEFITSFKAWDNGSFLRLPLKSGVLNPC